MSIPADFRRVLESGDPEWTTGLFPRMYLLYGDHLKNELHGYTVNEFTALVDQINALPRGSVKKKKLSRLIIGQSIKLDVDKDGRTVELKFSGLGDHFEIWKAETFAAEIADDMADWLDAQGDDFDPLSLLDE